MDNNLSNNFNNVNNFAKADEGVILMNEDVQLLKEVIMKGNDKDLICVVDLSDNMVKHVIHQTQFDIELSIIEDVRHLPEFQAKLMKDHTNYKEYVFQDVTNILNIIVVTKSPTQKKDEQVVIGYYKESRMLQSKSDVKINVLVIVFNILTRLNGRMLKGI